MKAPIQTKGTRARKKQAPRSLAHIMRELHIQLPYLSVAFPIRSLGLFGSYVRHEAKPRSDLDVLIEFAPDWSYPQLFALQEHLSKLLGVEVDIANAQSLKPYIGRRILTEVVWLRKDGERLRLNLPARKRPSKPNSKPNGGAIESKREYLDYMQDMLTSMRDAQSFVAGISLEQLIQELMRLYAVQYAVQTVGEAANRIPPDVQARYPDIRWKDMIGMRNIIVHRYDAVQREQLWKTLTESIARIQPLIAQMLEAEKQRRGIDEIEKQTHQRLVGSSFSAFPFASLRLRSGRSAQGLRLRPLR